MQGFGSPDEDRDGDFAYGGWGAPYMDEVQFESALEGLRTTSAYLFGRRTYEHMNAFWPHQPDDNPRGARFHLDFSPSAKTPRERGGPTAGSRGGSWLQAGADTRPSRGLPFEPPSSLVAETMRAR